VQSGVRRAMLLVEGERRERPRIEQIWSRFSGGIVKWNDTPTSLPLSRSQRGNFSGEADLIHTVQLFAV
jgi:hypothetical protein